jgi:hypothetical protein
MTLIYDAAKKYLRNNYSVIPIRKGEKRPLIDWKIYQERLPTNDEISIWFKNTDNQLGLITGLASRGLFILDFDGVEWKLILEEFINKFPEFLDSLFVQTGSGKLHIYGRCLNMKKDLTREFRSFSKEKQKLAVLELRANKHQTLCPPSLHPSGGQYCFIDDSKEPIVISKRRLNEIIMWLKI